MAKKKGRGSGTGKGHGKKGRGAGNRGGRGNVGHGKKSKHKKMADGPTLGGKGFNRPQELVQDTTEINLRDIDRNIEAFAERGVAERDGDTYVFDAEAAGYDKVLGAGTLTRDIDIRAPAFSTSAREKIEESGNEAIDAE